MNKKVFSNFIWRFAERCGAQGVTFIVSIILARVLDPAVYGTVALVTVWKSIGYYCLIIIAGLQSLPRDVYEAARLDKASRWTILRRITLPLMRPTLSFVFIMKFINAFKSFSAIDVMTQGGPQGSSMVLGYWIYNAGRVKFNYGFAMVGAIVLTALVAVFTLLANKGFRKED